MLEDAKKYHVDLSDLESPKVPSSSMKHKIISQVPIANLQLDAIDINLKEVCNKIFSDSARLVFVVRDDKVAYANAAAINFLNANSDLDILDKSFLNIVEQKDWNTVAVNIGEMLTLGRKVKITLKNAKESLEFCAIYVADSQHFSFVLVSEGGLLGVHRPETFGVMFDSVTGLPSFPLFEDRLQMAINHEVYKDARLKRNMVSIIGVNIENLADLQKQGVVDFVLKKVANSLVMSVKKHYTVARGVQYSFWILLNDMQSIEDVNMELEKLEYLLSQSLKDGSTEYFLKYSLTHSSYPKEASSARKLLEIALSKGQKN